MDEIKTYTINQTYTIKPFSGDTKSHEARFVGYMQFKDTDNLNFPVFNFDFYSFPPKNCYMVLYKDRCFVCGRSIEEMKQSFLTYIDYVGEGYEKIRIGYWFSKKEDIMVDKDEFFKQARATTMDQKHIDESIQRGYYNMVHGKHGEIKFCPTCNVLRDTTCCACGCGSCMVCEYRWCCSPLDISSIKTPIPLTATLPTNKFQMYNPSPDQVLNNKIIELTNKYKEDLTKIIENKS